ncbi:MAG: type II toxin-antitoxin system HicB family antitoxin [Rhodoferax sp.]|nr:type II toxin-antitoxin system HicB family antitoxin [Rhodoferax sp.]
MKFIIAIEPGDDTHSFGVVVPDLPGCVSAGDTIDEAIANAHEAIDLWCETVLADGGNIPVGKTITEHQKDPEFGGWVWALVDVPVEKYLGPAEKINITVPRLLLSRIDDYARAHGATRSGFLVQAARAAMAAQP